MKPPQQETVIKKVRRRRTSRFRAYHFPLLALLIPIFFLPSSVPGGSEVESAQATQQRILKSHAVEIGAGDRPDSNELNDDEIVEGSAPSSLAPLHVAPIDIEISPQQFAKLNGAVPLDRALLPDPPRPFIVIETRRASDRRERGGSTTATVTSTTASLSPVPEPSISLLLVVGTCGALLRRRR